MSAEEDGDLFGVIVNVDFGKLLDDVFRRLERLDLGGGGSAPDEDDNAADEDGDGGGDEHEEVAVLEEDGAAGQSTMGSLRCVVASCE